MTHAAREQQREPEPLEHRQHRHDRRVRDQAPQQEPGRVHQAAQHVRAPDADRALQRRRPPHHRHLDDAAEGGADTDEERAAAAALDLQRDEVPRAGEADPDERDRRPGTSRTEAPRGRPRRRRRGGPRARSVWARPPRSCRPQQHQEAREGVDARATARRSLEERAQRQARTGVAQALPRRGSGRSPPSARRPGASSAIASMFGPAALPTPANIAASATIGTMPSPNSEERERHRAAGQHAHLQHPPPAEPGVGEVPQHRIAHNPRERHHGDDEADLRSDRPRSFRNSAKNGKKHATTMPNRTNSTWIETAGRTWSLKRGRGLAGVRCRSTRPPVSPTAGPIPEIAHRPCGGGTSGSYAKCSSAVSRNRKWTA